MILNMKKYKTEQEEFWAGEFGNEYVNRNNSEVLFASNLALFSRILQRTTEVKTIIEYGANIGMNLSAIHTLLPNASLSAVEINERAAEQLEKLNYVNVFKQSILDFSPNDQYDFVLIKGVLIHINPDELLNVYEKMYNTSKKYICIAEYYNPAPVQINYRGHQNKLFKRDFAGEMLEKYNLTLIDYGFVYHGDPCFPQDDITWFLLEKNPNKQELF